MAEPFLGEVKMVGFTFAPRGWAFCDGQLLPIAQNSSLFSLLGTIYGGDGRTTFALPNLRGRAAMHTGMGPGLTPRSPGETGGEETVALTADEIPVHTHTLSVATADTGDTTNPQNSSLAKPAVLKFGELYSNAAPDTTLHPSALGSAAQPHNNMQPFLVLNFVIALQGVFPS